MTVVRVNRDQAVEEQRLKLPAVLTEQEIIDSVQSNDFSIICGDTGCGKSTQVPQFLYEASYTEGDKKGFLIGITQPRRVAAIALAERVGFELNDADLVGYQVRYETRIMNEKMRLKFMTDGILLREIQEDIRLPRYSVIVIDEAHERSINCDMLLGLLSGSIRARKGTRCPLKVVIMSATLRMSDFTDNKMLFPQVKSCAPSVVQIENRMHPVVVHYERRTEEDYVSLAVEKIRKIHKTLPAGSILVFVTGKSEVHKICEAIEVDHEEDSCERIISQDEKRVRAVVLEDNQLVEDFSLGQQDARFSETLTFGNGNKPAEAAPSREGGGGQFSGGGPCARLRVVPLYAQMHADRQMHAFSAEKTFPNDRIVVVATNVAETSLTIPNVRYVIDCGREKRKEFNSSGVSRFAVRFTSKASANQRAGRAGRVGPGHVYRLYSPNVFGEHMAEFDLAEIETNPLDSAILFLKGIGVSSLSHFPWPSPPPASHVEAAVKRLKAIGALESLSDKLTLLGKKIALLPIAPRLAVIILSGINKAGIDFAHKSVLLLLLIALVSMMSVDCLVAQPAAEKAVEVRNTAFSDDLEMMLTFFSDELVVPNEFLNPKAMAEANALFLQLIKQIARQAEWKSFVEPWQNDPRAALREVKISNFARLVRECCSHAFIDQLAVKEEAGSKKYRVAGSDLVTIHRSSPCYRLRPQLIGFMEIQQASGEFGNHNRTLRICFPVDPEYIASLDSVLVDKSKNHPFMKPSVSSDGKKFRWAIAKYTPLSLTLSECVKV